jgi:hypothetical protein
MAIKTVYQVGADRVCAGSATAYESPLEPGVFHLPAGCVDAVPPGPEAGKAPVWTGDAWSSVPDHRGETWYVNGAAKTVDFVGDPTERGYSPTPPSRSLDDLRADKLAAIISAADALLTTGAPVESGLHVALDDGSRADLTAMAATATAASAGAVPWLDSYARGWITVENARIPLVTPAAGLALAASVGNYYAAIIQHRRDLKDAALSAEDAAALEAIDIAAGWPA